MDGKKKKIIGTTAGALLLLGGGAAVASTGVFDPQETSQEIIANAAQDLGISAGELSDALRSASVDQVDAALEAGDITQEQADAMKELIESGDFPLIGGGFGHHGLGGFSHGPVGLDIFGAAADYLGLTDEQIRTRLLRGKTLTQIAKAEDKTVEGLVDALVEVPRSSLQEAVGDGRLSRSQRDEILDDIEDRVRDLVQNGMRPRERGFGPGPGGPGRWPFW